MNPLKLHNMREKGSKGFYYCHTKKQIQKRCVCKGANETKNKDMCRS